MSQTYILDAEDPLTLELEVSSDRFVALTPLQIEHNREVSWYNTSGYLNKNPIS